MTFKNNHILKLRTLSATYRPLIRKIEKCVEIMTLPKTKEE